MKKMFILLAAMAFTATTFAVEVGKPAPDFTGTDINGKTVKLSDYKGKVVLLDFWATWCPPCRKEIPGFVDLYSTYKSRGLVVIGVSMDDATAEVIATVSRLKLNYPVLMGDEYLGAAYGGVLGLPVTFLIDRDGKIRARYQGASLTRIKGDIQNLLQSH